MFRIFFVVIFLVFKINTFAQTHWKIKTDSGEEILLTFEFDKNGKTFNAYSRKDAVKDIAGVIAFNMARAIGKIRYPEIVRIEGTFEQKNDSLKLKGIFYYTDDQYNFEAVTFGNKFNGSFTDNRKRRNPLTGVQVTNDKPLRDYSSILDAALSISSKNLPDPSWVKSSDWKDFEKKLDVIKPNISDDYEFGAVMLWYSRDLPFSPFEVYKTRSGSKRKGRNPSIKMLNQETGLLELNSIPVSTHEMDSIANEIEKNNISKLIIDARGKILLTPEKILPLLNYLSENEFYAGAFITSKWWKVNSAAPRNIDFNTKLTILTEADSLFDFNGKPGFSIHVVPSQKPFKGEIFVLTDSRTSRVAESFVSILKKNNKTRIVGEPTAGMPVYTSVQKVNEDFSLHLPVALFYNANGKTFINKGIDPDISVSPDKAISFILKSDKLKKHY